MPSKEQLATAAVVACRAMVRAGEEYGIESAAAQQAAQLANRALTAAEDAGCTRVDYEAARATR
ncbi:MULTISPECIES: hypothetical protein [Streptomyces]|uniref:Uncharacterized protein n=1 Tax=Streptomyces sudanensis TaxID=436397 RepID=A0ABY4TAX9_9ACTN|nr:MULTISPECIES: hypothetical protein [Streptomyces]URN16119.1 hypothetical protein MW084_09360 [Streptomyces sudanensis]